MLKVFVLEKNFGMAVIQAEDPEEALRLLKEYEDDSPYLTHQVSVDDFKIIPSDDTPGIVVYSAI